MDEAVVAGIAGAEVMLESERTKWDSRRQSARQRLSSMGTGSTDPREVYRNSSDPNDPMHENFPKVTTEEKNALVPVVVSAVGHVSRAAIYLRHPDTPNHTPRPAAQPYRRAHPHRSNRARIHRSSVTETMVRADGWILIAKQCGLPERLGPSLCEGSRDVHTRIACLDRARGSVRRQQHVLSRAG